jgi:hypothetical protein
VALFELTVRGRRFGEREDAIDVDADRPRIQKACEGGEHDTVGYDLVRRRPHRGGRRRLGVARPGAGGNEHVQTAAADDPEERDPVASCALPTRSMTTSTSPTTSSNRVVKRSMTTDAPSSRSQPRLGPTRWR